MADSKISALTAASALDGTELVPGVQGGSNVKITAAQIIGQPLGIATGTSLALGGATIGSNALAVTGLVFNTGTANVVYYAVNNSATTGLGLASSAAGTPAIYLGGSEIQQWDGTFSRLSTNLYLNGSSLTILFLGDMILSRAAAASLQLGAANAASPVSQTLRTQGSRAGTDSNVGGGSFTIEPGLGTGTGTPSDLVLKGVVGTTTGTGAQAYSTGLTIKGVAAGQLPSIVLGSAALATDATDGFLYIPTCAGAPTGTPTAATGRVALIYDTTNNKFYVYNGAWKGGTAPGAWS